MECLRPVWLELERAAGLTLYQSFRWNYAAARFLRAAPCVVAVHNSSGAAIIPAALEDDALTFLGDALFDYRDVLSNDGAALAEGWRVLASLERPLRFAAVRADSPHGFWAAGGRADFCRAPMVSRDDISAEEFARRHWRQAKQVRRLLREGANLVRADGRESGLVRWIYKDKAAQLAGSAGNVFADAGRIEFMVAMAAREGSRCQVYGFEAGGTIVSSLITFRDEPPGARPIRRYYTTTFDRRWGHFSPGIALLYEVARQSLAEGMDVDLQTGEQFHKSRLATRSALLYRVDASSEQMTGFAEALAGGARMAA